MAFLINITSTAYISGLSKSVNLYNLKGQFLRSDACLPCNCMGHVEERNVTTGKYVKLWLKYVKLIMFIWKLTLAIFRVAKTYWLASR